MRKKIKRSKVYFLWSWHYPPFKISPPEKCSVLHSLFLIFSFFSFIFSSIFFKCSFSSICLSFFHLLQFFSNFFKYSSSNFLSSYPYSSFAIYFPGNSILLYSSFSLFFSTTLSWCLISTPNLPSKSFTNSFAFFKSSSFSQISLSAVNPFYHTKYLSTSLIFLLFNIFSTSHSLTPSTSTGFPSSLFCSFTYSVRIAEGGLNFFLLFIVFLILFSLSFSIYFLFLELGLGLEWQDHAVTQQVTSDDTVTSHMIHRRT